MKLKILSGIAAIAALAGTPALAAEMPLKAPAALPVFDWSGIYVGGDLGWQGSSIRVWDPAPGFPLAYQATHSSFAGGGFIGIQKQFNQVVLGIEGDYLAATGSASLGTTTDISIFGPGNTGTGQVKLRNLWSVGGRAGWAMGRWMPYVAGGYANAAFEFDAQNTPPLVVGPETETAKASGGGAYIGVGVDWAMTNNWIIGAEYRHYSFATLSGTGVQSGTFAGTEQVDFGTHIDTVMARLSYKFDWGLH